MANDERSAGEAPRFLLAGVFVREEDLEPQTGLSVVARTFRVLAAVLVGLMLVQVVLGLGNPGPGAIGHLAGEAIKLLVFAGLLWAIGDLATVHVKSFYELRATRILLARQTHMLRLMGERSGELEPLDAPHARSRDPL
jgi:hypothetical protein